MKNIMLKTTVGSFTVALLVTVLVACGGSSSSEQAAPPPVAGPTATTGTVGLLFTDGTVTRIRPQDDGTVTEDIAFADLAPDDAIDAYGLPAVDGCFEATSIVADETLAEDEDA